MTEKNLPCPLCDADMSVPISVTRCEQCRNFDEGISEHCRICGGVNRLYQVCEDCISDYWHWIDGEANGRDTGHAEAFLIACQ